MKNPRTSRPARQGFTLVELLVAMAITTIIVAALVSITSVAVDTWNRSRSELRAARQAKAMVDTMARDFETLVFRTDNPNEEWLSATSETPSTSTNAARLVFFTAAADRYNGNLGSPADLGGDVSCVGYQLAWKDPISGGTAANQTFVLNRYLVNPDETFANLLGNSNIGTSFTNTYGNNLNAVENFICENVFQFTVTFHVATASGQSELVTIKGTTSLRLKSSGIETNPSNPNLSSGTLTSVGISVTVLSDSGVAALRKNATLAGDAAWLAKNSFEYSKRVELPAASH